MLHRYALLSLVCLISLPSIADHLPGGTITTRCMGGNFHEITLKLFRNCSGPAMVPQTLVFSNDCGVQFELTDLLPQSVEEVSPLCPDQLPNSTCNGGALIGFELYTYRTTVYLSPCDSWNIHWAICCRNPSLNVQQSPGLWIEAIVNNAGGLCNATPVFVDNSIPLVCAGQPVSYDASATDTEGNTLRYHLIDARFGAPVPTSVQYFGGYSGAEPIPGMAIDSITGSITFQSTLTGNVITVVQVSEYGEDGTLISSVMRDFLFVLSNCDNSVPSIASGTFTAVTGTVTITGDRSLRVCSEEAFCASLAFTDADLDQSLTITSNVGNILPGATIEMAGTNPAAVELCWNSTGAQEGIYQFTITATDDACPVEGFQQFAYTITVGSAGLAGIDTQVDYCGNSQPFAMIDLLDGNPSPGGAWNNADGDPLSGVFTPGTDEAGDYRYTFNGSGACSASATLSLVLLNAMDPECIGLSVPERGVNSLRVLPDASGGAHFLLVAPRSGTFNITVLTSDGRTVLGQKVGLTAESRHPLDLSDMASGAYILRMVPSSGPGVFSGRVVVH